MSGYDIDAIKQSASGRWVEVLSSVGGISRELLDGKHHPCPKCGGTDRFRLVDESLGAVLCNQCFNSKNGDGLAAVQWALNASFADACKLLVDYLVLNRRGPRADLDIVATVARAKHMPLDAFRQFGAEAAKRGRIDVARVPVYNHAGEQHSFFDLTANDKGWFKKGKGTSGLFFPGRLPAEGETWLITEGVKDAAALLGLGYLASGLNTSHMAAKFSPLFQGAHVIIVPDLDEPALRGADLTASRLAGVAASVRTARLPGEMTTSGGADVRDVLKYPDGEQMIHGAIEAAFPWTPDAGSSHPTSDRPSVLVTKDEASVTRGVIYYLGKLGWETPWIRDEFAEEVKLYQRAGKLVQLLEREDVEDCGTLYLRDVPASIVRERITQACSLVEQRHTKEDEEPEEFPVRPPKWLVDAIHDRQQFNGNILPLSGVIHAPTIRPDGSILQSPGYDKATGLYFQCRSQFPAVPQNPRRQEAEKAASELLEVVADFPMLTDADRSAWLAMLLTMIGRTAFRGCSPLFAITANIRGAGKSLLVDAAAIIAYGRAAPRKTYTADPEETRKLITATVIEAAAVALLDNIDRRLGGAALDAVLTAETWNDRVLGSSRTTGELPMRTVWCATGNNISYGSDVARRVLPLRLESTLEQPENRTGFTHPNLLAWVLDNRPRLACAALTILRAWFAAERPEFEGGQWGSYEAWSSVIRNALIWAGQADPLPTREQAVAEDESRELLSLLIAGLEEADPEREGLTTQEIERLLRYRPDEQCTCPTLQQAAGIICGPKFNVRQFGKRVSTFSGRVCEGRQIRKVQVRSNRKKWVVAEVRSGELDGFGESVYPYVRNGSDTHSTYGTYTHDAYRNRGELDSPNPSNSSCGNGGVSQ